MNHNILNCFYRKYGITEPDVDDNEGVLQAVAGEHKEIEISRTAEELSNQRYFSPQIIKEIYELLTEISR